jgi:hypothetical protein
MKKMAKNEDNLSFSEKSAISRKFHLGRLTGWRREIADKSDDSFILPFVLCLERCVHSTKFNALLVPAAFDEKMFLKDKNLEIIKSILGQSILIYSYQSLARKLAEEYLETCHIELKKIAKEEGWGGFLSTYLSSTAMTQAQFMTKAHVSYSVPPHLTTGKKDAGHLKEYLKHCELIAEQGAVKVSINQKIINAMKEQRVLHNEKTGDLGVPRPGERPLEEERRKKSHDALLTYLSQEMPESLLKMRENNTFTNSFINH